MRGFLTEEFAEFGWGEGIRTPVCPLQFPVLSCSIDSKSPIAVPRCMQCCVAHAAWGCRKLPSAPERLKSPHSISVQTCRSVVTTYAVPCAVERVYRILPFIPPSLISMLLLKICTLFHAHVFSGSHLQSRLDFCSPQTRRHGAVFC
jgi:hypothetical protein